MANIRKLAIELLRAAENGENINAILSAKAENLTDGRDRALLVNIVDGSLRNKLYLENIIDGLLNTSIKKISKPVKYILITGAYQLIFLDRVPPHAIVNESVKLTPNGTKNLVNAILRRVAERKEQYLSETDNDNSIDALSIKYSHPKWLIERWEAAYGLEATTALLKANNEPPKSCVRTNKRWVTRDALFSFLTARELNLKLCEYSRFGIEIIKGGNLASLPEYSEGLFSVQGEASMLVAELLRPGRGKRGWDMAAGVGGKSTHIAEWIDDNGYLLCTDTAAERLEVLTKETERLSLESIEVKHANALTMKVDEPFDYILLDAPCSGTGALSKQADARYKKSDENILENADLQARLLEKAAKSLKSGGILLYSTCSLEHEENEGQIEQFLAKHPEFSLADLSEEKYIPRECYTEDNKFLKCFPHIHKTDGFFAAKLIMR